MRQSYCTACRCTRWIDIEDNWCTGGHFLRDLPNDTNAKEEKGTTMTTMDEVYTDRNNAVQLAAAFALLAGFRVGWRVDEQEGERWPVLYIDTPQGQVSWHIPATELAPGWPLYPDTWDGHDASAKINRIRATIGRATTRFRE
jgi:hypothetical protein